MSVTVSSGEVWTWRTRCNWYSLDCLFLPWNFNCLFTSRSDNYFVISGHILQGKFLLKYKSTVSHQLSGPTMLLALESQIYVVIVLQKEFNRTMTWRRSTDFVRVPLCQACLRDKKPILKRNPIKNWQNMDLILHKCF